MLAGEVEIQAGRTHVNEEVKSDYGLNDSSDDE